VRSVANSDANQTPLGADNGPGFGWRDITVIKTGLDYALNSTLTLRGGYNHSCAPFNSSQTFLNLLAPAVTQDHLHVGATWTLNSGKEINLAYVHAFEGARERDKPNTSERRWRQCQPIHVSEFHSGKLWMEERQIASVGERANRMTAWLTDTWPWYVAGPVIGLFVPALLLVGNKVFGISSNLRHLCSALVPGKLEYFRYDWKSAGLWNLVFLFGVLAGGFLAAHLGPQRSIAISNETTAALAHLGIHDLSGVAPHEIFGWRALLTLRGFISVVVGGFLVGFGTAYAGGCTSGHAISGLANFELPSLIAVVGFFAGGLAATYFILPFLLRQI
jgi:uncharacterized membrane protein YedE/YeeE